MTISERQVSSQSNSDTPITENTLSYFEAWANDKMSVEAIAVDRGVKSGTVLTHLMKVAASGDYAIDWSRFGIPDKVYQDVAKIVARIGEACTLREIKSELDDESVGWDAIRVAKARYSTDHAQGKVSFSSVATAAAPLPAPVKQAAAQLGAGSKRKLPPSFGVRPAPVRAASARPGTTLAKKHRGNTIGAAFEAQAAAGKDEVVAKAEAPPAGVVATRPGHQPQSIFSPDFGKAPAACSAAGAPPVGGNLASALSAFLGAGAGKTPREIVAALTAFPKSEVVQTLKRMEEEVAIYLDANGRFHLL